MSEVFKFVVIVGIVVLFSFTCTNSPNMTYLPKPTGPYAVAATDIITEVGKNGTFFRLFYPTKKFNPTLEKSIPWAEHVEYSYGAARFTKLTWFGRLVHNFAKKYHLPVYRDGPLLMPNDKDKLPVFVFSHGLGGTRSMQSFTCYDLASHGVFVAAIEHKDHSASATYYLEKEEESETLVKKWMNYIPAPSDKIKEFNFRNSQINQRANECSDLVDHLISLNEGNLANVIDGVDMSVFKGRLDMDHCSIYGHSFGGGTTIKALSQDKRLKSGVLLDAWMYPIEKEFYHKPVSQPMLFVNNEAFMWHENLAAIRKLDNDVHGTDADRAMLTILGAVHWSQTDLTFILPNYWLVNRIFKASGTTDVIRVNNITSMATRQFFSKHTSMELEEGLKDVLSEHSDVVIKGSNIKLDENKVKISKDKIQANL